jgi:hypothetical protein
MSLSKGQYFTLHALLENPQFDPSELLFHTHTEAL